MDKLTYRLTNKLINWLNFFFLTKKFLTGSWSSLAQPAYQHIVTEILQTNNFDQHINL